MNQQLRQITGNTVNIPLPSRDKAQPPRPDIDTIHQLLKVNAETEIDFRQCIPGTVHEKKLAITLKEQQSSPKIISMVIVCQDQKLNELPEYIFGVRKQNSYEYFDEFRFKAIQKGTYNFIVGVKTPNVTDYFVKAKLLLCVQGVKDAIQLVLKQQTIAPFVRCCKELVSDDGFRMIKLAVVKNKTKKETKLVFKCTENINLTLLAEILGAENQGSNEIEIKPKITQTGGKGMFLVTVAANCPAALEQKYAIRRILVFKVKDASCYFHFPMEVVFYPEGRQSANSQS